ncbi:survival motor neuron protein isoform X2 [Phymastichus coffea]|uniref:survival motor neuron protein isoform X2 n=1 Tax=Phymastichus coffea TaxID=108790 RepID=UPI00273B6155|nr:survival motor neuron protein isoform X2 [Phymastichus coffea]
MAEDDNLLFCRSSNNTKQDELWDDTALIKAYDKAINKAKEEVSKRLGLENPQSAAMSSTNSTGTKSKHKATSQKNQRRWCVGSPCRAVYSEDGIVYEAVIVKIFDDSKTCIVKFIGYENIEKVKLDSLTESEGLQSQIAQQKEAAEAEKNSANLEDDESHIANGYQENMDYETNEIKSFKNFYNPSSSFNPNFGAIPPAPPLPPQFMARLPENDADALSSMLMSWYISGFHTGYYHGMKQVQSNQGHRKK